MATSVRVVFDRAALARTLASSGGPVGRHLDRVGLQIESQAKINASGRPGPNVDTGRLRSSIHREVGQDSGGLFVRVGSPVSYAIHVEKGSTRAPAYPFLEPALRQVLGG